MCDGGDGENTEHRKMRPDLGSRLFWYGRIVVKQCYLIKSPPKVLEQQGKFLCFVFTLKTNDVQEMTNPNFSVYFLVFLFDLLKET